MCAFWDSVLRAQGIPYQTARTKLRDVALIPALIHQWGRYRQSYKFDPDFLNELLLMDHVSLPVEALHNTLYPRFYVDLSKVDHFAPFIGFFIYIAWEDGLPNLMLLRIQSPKNKGGEYYILHSAYVLADELKRTDILKEKDGHVFVEFSMDYEVGNTRRLMFDDKSHELKEAFKEKNLYDFLKFALQTVLYLSSSKSDIQRVEKQPRPIRLSYDGIRKEPGISVEINDVGVRYGSVIRIRKQQEKEETKRLGTSLSDKQRKSIASHVRCVHFHHYWTGPGKNGAVRKMAALTFVGAQEESVTIHRVKK